MLLSEAISCTTGPIDFFKRKKKKKRDAFGRFNILVKGQMSYRGDLVALHRCHQSWAYLSILNMKNKGLTSCWCCSQQWGQWSRDWDRGSDPGLPLSVQGHRAEPTDQEHCQGAWEQEATSPLHHPPGKGIKTRRTHPSFHNKHCSYSEAWRVTNSF